MRDRIDRAERRARRLRWVAAGMGALAATGLGLAAYSPVLLPWVPGVSLEPARQSSEADGAGRIVEAGEVVLKDRDGGTRARLGTLPDGAPYLQIMGKDGDGFAEMAVLPGVGTSLRLGDGRSLISAKVSEDGASELALYGKGEKARAALTVQADGMPVLGFTDEEGRVRAGLSLGPDGSPSISLYDQDGLRAVLGSSAASSSLVLLDREGRVIYQAPR